MQKKIWVVQWNLGGLSGPYKAVWDEETEAYYSECGDFQFDPVDCVKEWLWQVYFNNERDAYNFSDGCRFTKQWIAHRFRDHILDSDET